MIGAKVLGIYTVTRPLGEGGMGAVFVATSNTGHRIVIKVLHPEFTRHAAVLARFQQEASIAAQIRHRNVIQVLGTGTLDDGRTYLAMEFLQGKTLTDHAGSWGPQLAADVLPILLQLCAGLQAAHGQGIVHRDLKPDNVFICDEPEPLQVKILDFGISKQLGAPNGKASPLTGSGVIMGTPWYMAPEQAESARDVSTVSDIFAVGVIAFELLAGFRPYRSDKPDEGPLTFLTRYARVAQGLEPKPKLAAATPGRDDIPAAWHTTIDHAIDIRPGARPATVREFIEALYRAIPGGEETARRVAPSLLEAASPADVTRRAGSTGGDATAPGLHTAPHATVGSTTFHGASGQVVTASPPPRRRWIGLAIAAGAIAVVVVAAILASSSDDRPTATLPHSDAIIPLLDGGAVLDAAATGAYPPGVVDAPPDASATDALPVDAGADAQNARPRRPRPPRSPDDID